MNSSKISGTEKQENSLRVLVFGDVMGRPGREGVTKIIPQFKEDHSPDLIIANGENISHGKGISERTLQELFDAGVDVVTGGNHILEGKDADILLDNKKMNLIRPLNFVAGLPGRGALTITKNGVEILILNAIAQTHMRQQYNSPYEALEQALTENQDKKIIIVDWHADTTSEKRVLGFWLDGRVSLVYGTHTHVPTADEQILPKGTGYATDIGMTGAFHSVIGENPDKRIDILVHQKQTKSDIAEAPPYEINALLVDIDTSSGKCTNIQRLRQILGTLE
jgi:2',3'-cyclic-nucleotide 2'-phosphodiesterase